MQDEVIAKLVASIEHQQQLNSWQAIALTAIVAAIASALGAFGASYFKKRGESAAIKAEFAEVLRQLQETEELKAGVSSSSAERAALKSLLRQKMEIFPETAFEVESWLERTRNEAMLEGKTINVNSSPIMKLRAYEMMYFDELSTEMVDFNSAYKKLLSWNLNALYVLEQAKKNRTTPNLDIKASEIECLFPFQKSLSALQKGATEKYARQAGLRFWNSENEH